MDKRQQRTQVKMANIKRAAFDLFAAHGVDKVSVDEIAEKANVSKVTIYKYFDSKDNLYIEVINQFMEDMLAETEKVFHSELPFPEKLRFAIMSQNHLSKLVSYTYLFEVWEKNSHIAEEMQATLEKVKALMYAFYEEGKSQGYIDKDLSFDVLYLYAEIFRAGLRAKSLELEPVLKDQAVFDQLINLYFFGIIKRQ